MLQTFDVIIESGLKLTLSKCSVAQSQTSIRLLGHTVDEKNIAVDPAKGEAIRNAPVPTNTTKFGVSLASQATTVISYTSLLRFLSPSMRQNPEIKVSNVHRRCKRSSKNEVSS